MINLTLNVKNVACRGTQKNNAFVLSVTRIGGPMATKRVPKVPKPRKKRIIGRGTEREGLYYVDEMTTSETMMLDHGTSEREAWLWHKRLGHPSNTTSAGAQEQSSPNISATKDTVPNLISEEQSSPNISATEDTVPNLISEVSSSQPRNSLDEISENIHETVGVQEHEEPTLTEFDVKNAFLYGELKEEVYMEAPPGFSQHFKHGEVCKLKKSLYGLKQSPRSWFGTLAMKKYGYKQSNSDHTLFLKHEGDCVTCLITYVDDMIIIGNDESEIKKLKERLCAEFEMKDLGNLIYFLGIEVMRSPQGIFICQKKYILDLLAETGMIDCKAANTPMIINQKLFMKTKAKLANRDRVPAKESIRIMSDNKAAIQISENPMQHDITKHVEVDRHFIKEKLEAGIVKLPFVKSEDQFADILTKAVGMVILHKCLNKLHFERMKPVASQPVNLADKIRNIEGKNIKEGRLSVALRGVFPAGSYVHVMQSKEASEIFGAHENPVDEVNLIKKIVKLHELRNSKMVEGAAVSIPIEAVEKNTNLKKDIIKVAPLWVKLHHVPIVAYSEVGLSLITTQLGKPIMLDSFTSNMCVSSWGRNTYARALIEFFAKEDLKDSIVIAIPLSNGKGHSLAKIKIEYEWTPSRCANCKVFDHTNEKCPKNPKKDVPIPETDDGFTMYRKVDKGETSKKNDKEVNRNDGTAKQSAPKVTNVNNVPTMNSFGALSGDESETMGTTIINEDSDCEALDEELIIDDRNGQPGLNFSPKQNEVRQVISGNNLSVCAILESHVANSNLHKTCSLVFRHWDWSSNGAWCDKGTRIILDWNHNEVDVMVLTQDDQGVHTRVWLKKEKKELFCSFIYAHNECFKRRSLWAALSLHNQFIRNRPWCLLGDFNSTLFLDESTASSSRTNIAMRVLLCSVIGIGLLMELGVTRAQELYWTGIITSAFWVISMQPCSWMNPLLALLVRTLLCPRGADGILKKLDRIMANMEFSLDFVGAHAIFKPYRISDHAPSILCIPTKGKEKPKPFKFYNILSEHERFLDVVQDAWNKQYSGFFMFQIVRKLKSLKKPLRKLLFEKGNLHANVVRLRGELDLVQCLLDQDPFNSNLREKEAACVVDFNQAVLVEERFLKQKAKIHWLKEGDSNSAYFHKTVKNRVSRSRIDVADDAMFSMGDDKSPGPDGFSAAFFKDAWAVVGNEVIKAIREFFTNGKLLKELNHTIISLIPKVQTPTRVNDYRPISCCNVLFKCISKILANRIKHCLKTLVNLNQLAFIPRRSISDNILLTQELMHNYHLDSGAPRCAFKVNIQKAYDTVDWNFLRMILKGFGFHDRMILWIMECVSTTSYSICINGYLYGYFQGKRGLRQGDPLSSYLFTLVMEILTRMLKRRAKITPIVIISCIMAATGGLMFGYDVGVSGGVTSMPYFLKEFFPVVYRKTILGDLGSNYCKYDNQGLQLFTSSLYLAGLTATFFASYTTRQLGRRLTMLIAGVFFIIGVVFNAAAKNLAMLIVGRILLGCGVGFANQCFFLSEIAPTRIRGALNILFQLILFANLVNYFTARIEGGWGWRVSLGFAGIPALLLTVGALLVVDTPNSLIERGKLEEGKAVLIKIRGTENIEPKYLKLVASGRIAKEVKHPFRNLLQSKNRPQLIIAVALQFFQQFTGINAIMFYAPVLFRIYSVDKLGRRFLLLQAGVQMFCAQLVIAVILGFRVTDTSENLNSGFAMLVVIMIDDREGVEATLVVEEVHG
nr:sugar transport protein 13 [Tanacetum cinerariifolium]